MAALLALLTFASAFAGDFVETLYVQTATARDERAPSRAALLSVAMYGVSLIGWVITVKVSLWYILPEVAGLYCGTLYAMRHRAHA